MCLRSRLYNNPPLKLHLHKIITDLELSARSHDSLRHEVVYDHIPSTCTPSIAESPLVFHQRQDSQPQNLTGEVGSSAYLQQLLRQTGCLTCTFNSIILKIRRFDFDVARWPTVWSEECHSAACTDGKIEIAKESVRDEKKSWSEVPLASQVLLLTK